MRTLKVFPFAQRGMNQPERRSLTVVTVMLLATFSAAMSPIAAAEKSETLEVPHSSDPYVIFEASQQNHWRGSALHFETHFGNDGDMTDEVWMNYSITQDIDDDGNQDYLAFMWSDTDPYDWFNTSFYKHDWYQTYVNDLESANPVTIQGQWGGWYCQGAEGLTEEECNPLNAVNPEATWEANVSSESFSFEFTLDTFVTVDIDSMNQEVTLEVQQAPHNPGELSSTYQIDWNAWTSIPYALQQRDDYNWANNWNDNGNTESGTAVINMTTDGDYHVCYQLYNVTSIAQKDELSNDCGDVHIGPDTLHVALDFTSTRLNLHVDARADDDFADHNIMIECDVTDPNGNEISPTSSGGGLNLGGWYAADWNETGTPIWWEFSHETARHYHNVVEYPDIAGYWRADCDMIDSQTRDRSNDTILVSANETENISAYGSLGQLDESTFDEFTSQLTAPLRMYAFDPTNLIAATAQITATPFDGGNLNGDCNDNGWNYEKSEWWTTTSSSNTTLSADLSNFTVTGDALSLSYAVSPGTNSGWHVYTDEPVVYTTLCSTDGGVDVNFQRFYSNITNSWFGGAPLWASSDTNSLNMTIEVDVFSNGTLIQSKTIGGKQTDYMKWTMGMHELYRIFWCYNGNGSVAPELVNDGSDDCEDGSDEGWFALETDAQWTHHHFLEGLGTGLYMVKTRIVDYDPAGNTTISETETGPFTIRGNLEYEDMDWSYDTGESVEPRLYTTGITESEDDWTIAWELWDNDDVKKDQKHFDKYYDCVWEGGDQGDDSTEDSQWYCKGSPDWGGYHEQRSYCEDDAGNDRWYCTNDLQGDGTESNAEVHLDWMPGVTPVYDGEAPSHTWQFQFDLDDGSYRMCAGLYLSDELHSPAPYWLEDDFTHYEWTYDDEGNWGSYETPFRPGYDNQRECRDFHVGPPDVQVELWCFDCPDVSYRVEMSYGEWENHYYLEYDVFADGEDLFSKNASGNPDQIHHYGNFNIPTTAMQIEMDFKLYEHPSTMDCADGSATIDIWQVNDGIDDCSDGSDEGYDYTNGNLVLIQEGSFTWDLPPRFIVEGGMFSALESVVLGAGYVGYDATKVTDASLEWNLHGPDNYSSGSVTKMYETFDHGLLAPGQWNFCVHGHIELNDGTVMDEHQCSQNWVSIPFSTLEHHYDPHESIHWITGQFVTHGTLDEHYDGDGEDPLSSPILPEYNISMILQTDDDDPENIMEYGAGWLSHEQNDWFFASDDAYYAECDAHAQQWHYSQNRLLQFGFNCRFEELFPGDYIVTSQLFRAGAQPTLTASESIHVDGWLKFAGLDNGYEVRHDLGEDVSIDFDALGLGPGTIDWNMYTFDDGRDIWSLVHDDGDDVLRYDRIVHWGETSSVLAGSIFDWDASSSTVTIEVNPSEEGIFFLCAEWTDDDGNYTRTDECAPIFVGDIPVDVYAHNGLDWNNGAGMLVVDLMVLFPQGDPDHLILTITKGGEDVYTEQFNCTEEKTDGWWEDEYNETTNETTQVWVEESWTEAHCEDEIEEQLEFVSSQLDGPGEYDITITLFDENSAEMVSASTTVEFTGLFGDFGMMSMRCGEQDWWSDGDHIECGSDASPTVEVQYETLSTNESITEFEIQGTVRDDSGAIIHSESLSIGQLFDEKTNDHEWDHFAHCEWRGDDEMDAWACQWDENAPPNLEDEQRPYCEYDESEDQWYCNYMVDWHEASEDDQDNSRHLADPITIVHYRGSTTITVSDIGHYDLELNMVTTSGSMQASRHASMDVRYHGPVVVSGPLFNHFNSGESTSFFFGIEENNDRDDDSDDNEIEWNQYDHCEWEGLDNAEEENTDTRWWCTNDFDENNDVNNWEDWWYYCEYDAGEELYWNEGWYCTDELGQSSEYEDSESGTMHLGEGSETGPVEAPVESYEGVYYEVRDDSDSAVAQGTINGDDMVKFQTNRGANIAGGSGEIGVLPDGDYVLEAWLIEDGAVISESSALSAWSSDGDGDWPFAEFSVGGDTPPITVSTTFDGEGGVIVSVSAESGIENVMILKLGYDEGDEPSMISLDQNGEGNTTFPLGIGGLMVILALDADDLPEDGSDSEIFSNDFAFKFMFIHPEYIDQDIDGDGLSGTDDMCPALPGPASQYGCPLVDADQDGVWDHEDSCLGTDDNAIIDANGCEIAQAVDSDQDGISDDQDACPFASGTLSDGCPDQDGDGVVGDECPTEAGPLSNLGCPVQTAQENSLPACDVFVTRIDGVDASSQNKRGTATSNTTVPVSIQAGNVTIKIHCIDPDGDAVAVTITDQLTNQNFAFPAALLPIEQTVALFQTAEPVVFSVEWSDGTAFGTFDIAITVQADPNAADGDAAAAGGPVGGFVPGVGLFTSLMFLGMVAALIRPRDARRPEE